MKKNLHRKIDDVNLEKGMLLMMNNDVVVVVVDVDDVEELMINNLTVSLMIHDYLDRLLADFHINSLADADIGRKHLLLVNRLKMMLSLDYHRLNDTCKLVFVSFSYNCPF